MNLRHSLRLLLLHNKQFWQKLRYDLGRELVVLVSAAVLLGLFAYIFRDFVGEKIRIIPEEQQIGIARGFAAVLLIVLGPLVAGPIQRLWRSEPSLRSFAFRSGDHPLTLRNFLILQTLVLLVIAYGIYWLAVGRHWGHWSLGQALLWQAISLGLGALRLVFGREKAESLMKPLLDDRKATRKATLLAWRWKQILLRNRLAKICLGLALLMLVAIGGVLLLKGPFALCVLMSMAAGLLIACAPSFQLEEDMRAIWFERQISCSHEEYVAVYQSLCLRLAVGYGLLAFVLACLGAGFAEPLTLLKLGAITALFPALLPAVMFQLAPERPVLQIMIIALIGLFLGTAIFAHWASLVIVPIALTYAKQYQQNNFYRS